MVSQRLARGLRFFIVISMVLAGTGPRVHAASVTWSGTTSTAWGTASNWGGATPTNGDYLIFNTDPSSQPSNNNLSGLSIGNLTILSSTFSNSLTLGGNAFTLAVPASVNGASFARTSGTTTVTVTQANHGLTTGQFVNLATGSAGTDGFYQVTVTSGSTFTYTSATNSALSASGTYTLAALTLSNTTPGRTTTISNNVALSGAQTWGFLANANTALIMSGNLTGSADLTIGAGVASNSASTLPNLRLTGANNSGYTGAISFTPTDSGVLLGSAGSMTGGLININGNNRNVWLTGGAASGTYAFGIGGTDVSGGRVQFRGAGTSGLYLTGGDVTWNPAGGTNYVWSGAGAGNTALDFGGSNDATPRMFYLGNAAGTFAISGTDKSFRTVAAGNNPGRVTLLSALADANEGTARTLTTDLPLLVLTKAAVNQSATNPLKVTVSGGGMAITNLNQIPNGNLNLSGGALILDNLSWSTLTAARTLGSGTGQFRFTGGGLAARGTDVTVPNDTSGGLSASTFDTNLVIGSGVLDADGTLYAKAGVTIARDTTLTAARTVSVGANGVGLGPGTPVLNKLSGNLSGTGALVVAGVGNVTNGGVLVLAGTNSWTGASSGTINTGVIFNTGSGGLQTSNAIVQFASDASLPSGNGGTTAFIGAVQRNSSTPFGYLLTGNGSGATYDLPAGYRFLLGSMSTSGNSATFGADGGKATLAASTVLVHAGNAAGDAQSLTLLVRDAAQLTLGASGSSVRLVPSTGQSSGTSATATTVSDASGTRTLIKRGEGTLALGNVAYTNVAETGTTASQFAWQIGRGTAGNNGAATYFDGAVRGLSPNDLAANDSNSLKNFFLALRGGVYEIDNSGGGSGTFTATLGTSGTGKVSVGNVVGTNSLGGGGFSAFGGNVTVTLSATSGTTTNLQWAASSSGFVQAIDPLMFGSQTASGVLTFASGIDLNGGFREIRVYDNASSANDYAVMSGTLSGNSLSGINKTGAGLLELSAANTHSGTTTAAAGTLRLSNNLALQNSALDTSGTGAVTLTVTSPTFGGLVGSTNLAAVITSGYGNVTSLTFNPGSGLTRTYTGAITDGAAGMTVTKTGAGTQILGGANAYTGNTTVSSGTLQLGVGTNLVGNIANAAALELVQGDSTTGVASGLISGTGSLTMTGTGVVRLSNTANTYTGKTTIASGVLEAVALSGSGIAGSLGQPTGANATIDLGATTTTGTLRYVGSGSATTNRPFSLAGTTGGGVIDASGGGPLSLSGSVSGGTGTKTFTLTGTSTGLNTIGTITGTGVSVVKDGTGLWRMNAASKGFGGTLTVKNGTLQVANGGAVGDTVAIGDTAAGASGVAAFLLEQNVTALSNYDVLASAGTQAVLIGGANTTGTATFGGSRQIRMSRDVTLVAATGGTVDFGNTWAGATNGSPAEKNVTIGAAGYAGRVLLNGGTLATSGSVAIQYGTAVLGRDTRVSAGGTLMTSLGATLAGTGFVTNAIGGAGLVAPGNSPGILTAGSLDPSAGTSFAFEFTGTTPNYLLRDDSVNDVLRLTDPTTPFTTSLTSANAIDVYFDVASLSAGDTFRGGFYTDTGSSFWATISGADFNYWVSGTGAGQTTYNSKTYIPLAVFSPTLQVSATTVAQQASFVDGSVTGQVTQFTVVVPEPAALLLAGIGAACAGFLAWRRRR